MHEFSSIGHESIMLKTNMYDHFRDFTKCSRLIANYHNLNAITIKLYFIIKKYGLLLLL